MQPFVDAARGWITRHPWLILAFWGLVTGLVAWQSPDLTQLAAEGQTRLLPENTESAVAAERLQHGWPEQWFGCLAVLGFQRNEGLQAKDLEYAQSMVAALRSPERPETILRVVGTDSPPEIVERLVSEDGTLLLVLIAIDKGYVSPASHEAVAWIEQKIEDYHGDLPQGLSVLWTGEAVIGRDYMKNVQITLDRAMYVTIILLMVVLLVVYRSVWLAIVPLTTILIGLVVSRGVLGWMAEAGWEISPLVELFLIVILFGCGTDYGLFLSWRYGEFWNATNPAAAMRTTLGRSWLALVASAGTTIVGLSLMGTTKFKLFSSTGPSVALGLLIVLIASLTLTAVLLQLLGRWHPRSFRGMSSPRGQFWENLARVALTRPWIAWLTTVAFMLPATILGLKLSLANEFVQDTPGEMPRSTESLRDLQVVSSKFGQGVIAPLSLLIRSDQDMRGSEGLALIDDVSRLLSRQPSLAEVRSATQPLGSTAPLEPARLAARLRAVDEGFGELADGARRLEAGLTEGAAKLRLAVMLDDLTGGSILGSTRSEAQEPILKPNTTVPPPDPMTSGLLQATQALLGIRPPELPVTITSPPPATTPSPAAGAQQQLLDQLTMAASGAAEIRKGANRARDEIENILADPVGRNALDRLLINAKTVEENPALLRSFRAYISEDGHLARIDMLQRSRAFSSEALDEVEWLRNRLREVFGNTSPGEPAYGFSFTGANAMAADVRAVTRIDQRQSWVIVPLGVFIVLIIGLRSPLICLNLVGTMFLTYAFSLGVTHAVFVWGLGCEAIDWKVPYFLFVLLIAVGVDYNVFLMSRLQEETRSVGLFSGIVRSVAQTGALISSAAAITVCSFAALMFSPLISLQQLGFALVLGITTDAVLVRPLLVPCGHWLMNRHREQRVRRRGYMPPEAAESLHAADG